MDAPPKGPYVQAALFCERVLEEKDNVISVIRVIDRITHTVAGPDAPDDLPPFTYQLNGLIMLKPGDAKGRCNFTIIGERPGGQRTELGSGSIHFQGGAVQGVNIPIRLNVLFSQEGLYYFDFLVDGGLLTRMPLEVNYVRLKLAQGQPPGGT